jgi:uncharacterized membrane protein YeiH
VIDLNVLQWLDLAGVFVFASSGALVAARNRLDIVGFVVIGFITSVGGGTLRDLLVDVPVFWIQQSIYIWIALVAAVITFGFSGFIDKRRRWIVWFDAVGLSVFCVLGAAKGLEITGDPVISVMMGVVSAVFGGVLRDIICNEVPLIFRGEIYATAAFFGSALFVTAMTFDISKNLALWLGIGGALALRAGAILWGWSLPKSRGLHDPA